MKKRFLLTSVLMLLLTVLALSTSTYAWFTMSTTNSVNEFTVTAASASGGLAISADGQSFSTTSVSIANPANAAYDLTAGSDGTLYSLVSKDTGEVEEASSGKYNVFYLYFGTTSWGDIKVNVNHSYIVPEAYKDEIKDDDDAWRDSDDFVTAAVAAEADAKTAGTIVNKSTEGDISRDWIAGAFRMSMQVVGYQTSSASTWGAANTTQVAYTQDIQFFDALRTANLKKNTVTGKYSVDATGIATDAQATFQGVEEVSSKYYMNSTATTYTPTELLTNDSVIIASIYKNASGSTTYVPWIQDNYTIVKVAVTVWIDGQDSCAELPLTAGNIASALEFSLDNSDTTKYPNPTDYRTQIAFSSFTAQDGGFTWAIPTGACVSGATFTIYEGTITPDATTHEGTLPSTIVKTGLALTSNAVEGTIAAETTYTIAVEVEEDTGVTGFKFGDYTGIVKVGTQYYAYKTVTTPAGATE